jgi:uncharacterized membrane protein YfcA
LTATHNNRRRDSAVPEIDLLLALAGLVVGFTVGLTGMGGGAIMTPVLVLVFGVQPLAAVSSDLVVSLVMKPVGGAVHMRRGTVNKPLITWLVIGSVPAAFTGVLVLKALGDGVGVQNVVKTALGVALLLASVTIVAKAYLQMRDYARTRTLAAAGIAPAPVPPLRVKPLPTLLLGVIGGFVVGMTSVGSGSLIIVGLLLLYPTIKSSEVVGTDLVQAVPLVGAAALGHLLFGEVQLGLTASLLLGALPGVYVGARCSSRAPQAIIRWALVFVLIASGLKLVGLSTGATGVALLAIAIGGPALWTLARRRQGLPREWRIALRDPSGRRRLFWEALAVGAPPTPTSTGEAERAQR